MVACETFRSLYEKDFEDLGSGLLHNPQSTQPNRVLCSVGGSYFLSYRRHGQRWGSHTDERYNRYFLRSKNIKVYCPKRDIKVDDMKEELSDPSLRFLVLSCIDSDTEETLKNTVALIRELT